MGLDSRDLSRLGPKARAQILDAVQDFCAHHRTGPRLPKFRNQPTHRGTLRFDSRREAERYDALMLLSQAGAIRGLKLQPQFTLQESYVTPEGERVRAIRYIADFAYERKTAPDCNGTVYWLAVVEDVKSPATKTPQYELKRKLLREKLGISIVEV